MRELPKVATVASDSIMNDVMGMFMFEKKVTG